MKTTVYFAGKYSRFDNIQETINSAILQRDAFLKGNADKIDEIDHEDIKLVSWSGSNLFLAAIIILTYYPKTN